MRDIIKQIRDIGIIPVVTLSDVDKAVPLARALSDGGIPCAEVTFRTEEAAECIRRISTHVPQLLVGAGTVLTPAQADQAMNAGAKFAVSPGLSPHVARHCVDKDFLIIPGCVTPTEMEAALHMGINTVKFFPAQQAGGLAYIKAVAAPYPRLTFVPTGGINADNIGEYAAFDRVIACGGSWMVSPHLIDAGDFDAVTRLCRQAVHIVQQARSL
jgi:2-dehydro-3-deoxyphosphogluconate aldolase/(4S)-4-hydroxy-2-oxoglutarate aldolase